MYAFMQNIRVVLLIAFLFSSFHAFAQLSEGEKDYFFDDNAISSSKNTLKVDLLGLAQKELGLRWERAYVPKISFEAGAGILLEGYNHSLWNKVWGENEYRVHDGGCWLFLQNRFYYQKGFRSPYAHIGIKHRRFPRLTSTDYLVGTGWKLLAGNRFIIDFSFSLCWRNQNLKDGESYAFDGGSDSTVDMPISFNLGYLLF